jgi:GTP-binding protein
LHAPVVYAIGRSGKAKRNVDGEWGDLTCLFDTILEHIPAPGGDENAPFLMGVSSLDYNDYVGRMAIGKVSAGKAEPDKEVFLLKRDGKKIPGKIVKVETFSNLGRTVVPSVGTGDICCIAGLPDCDLGDTIALSGSAEPVPFTAIDAPTVAMNFIVNDSPLSGKDGEFLTSNFLRDRLMRETLSDPALLVEPTGSPDSMRVKGRGLLHLSILIEKMRREGFELQLSRPEIIYRDVDGVKMEPMERAEITVDAEYLGKVMELLGTRRGEILNVEPRQNQMHVLVRIPTRALIGLHGRILSATRGTAVLTSALDGFAEFKGEIPDRLAGVIVQQESGEAATYALDNLKTRGTFFLAPGTPVYEGMVVGEHVHERDIVVNVGRKKKLTNMRSSTADAMIVLSQPKILSLEEALEYIKGDELVEVTPKVIRLRKKLLKEHQRKRAEQGQPART